MQQGRKSVTQQGLEQSTMEKHIIFEDDQIRVIFQPGSSRELIFSFGDLITRAKGLSINAEKSLQKYGFNVIGVMPKQKSWFPASSMQPMYQAIKPILDQFELRIAYGGSMGGYAAIKYANLFGFQRVVSMVPQYSIDPDDIVDTRYGMFFQPNLHANMRVLAEDVSTTREYIVVYDPYCPEDRAHFEKLQALIPHVHVLHLPFTGHDAIAVLASSELLNDFLRHPFDAPYFYQKMRRVKKNSKFYYRKVIENLLTRHRDALGEILKSNSFQLDPQFFDAKQKQTLLRVLFNNKQVSEQDLQKLGITTFVPQDNRNLLLDQFDHGLVFNVISQKIESYAAGVIALNHKFLIPLQPKGTGLVYVQVQDERYMVVMNDRQVMKLVLAQDELATGMHPILMQKYVGYYTLNYKELRLSSDEFGQVFFVENADASCQFVVQPEQI